MLARTGTVVIPTLSVRDPAFVTRPEILDRPLLRAVAGPKILRAWFPVKHGPSLDARRLHLSYTCATLPVRR